MGRVARILTQELPPSIERLTLEPVQAGIPLVRRDLRPLRHRGLRERGGRQRREPRPGASSATRRAPTAGLVRRAARARPLLLGAPALSRASVFDPGDPLQLSLGAELSASYRIQPNLILSGSVRQRLLTTSESEANEVKPDYELPRVRTNAGPMPTPTTIRSSTT